MARFGVVDCRLVVSLVAMLGGTVVVVFICFSSSSALSLWPANGLNWTGLVGSKWDGIRPRRVRLDVHYFTDQSRVDRWSRGRTIPENHRMSDFLEPGQTATGTNDEEVRRTEVHFGKDVLGEDREKKELKENYDPPPPQHHTWCYLTPTQLQDYNKMFEESGGYDVGDVPYDAVDIPIKPVCLDSPKLLERMEKYSNLALEEHNRHNDTKYEFVKVLKATFSTGGARRYFITFQVKDMAGPGSPTLYSFRARVYDGFKSETIIEFCAPEPQSYLLYG